MNEDTAKPIEKIISQIDKNMDTISFNDLIKELTGTSFDELYKEYMSLGDENHAKSNLG